MELTHGRDEGFSADLYAPHSAKQHPGNFISHNHFFIRHVFASSISPTP
jgi:hypothetical protein